jgi:hypothetical protein
VDPLIAFIVAGRTIRGVNWGSLRDWLRLDRVGHIESTLYQSQRLPFPSHTSRPFITRRIRRRGAGRFLENGQTCLEIIILLPKFTNFVAMAFLLLHREPLKKSLKIGHTKGRVLLCALMSAWHLGGPRAAARRLGVGHRRRVQ